MKNLDYDVIIVGAGPAGTAAAWRLLKKGLSVVLLDRVDFPRAKPCAGGLTLKTLALMPYSIAPVIEHATTAFNIGIHGRAAQRFNLFAHHMDICAFSVRSAFDAFNLEKTRERGAQFKIVKKIEAIKEHIDHVELMAGGTSIRARYVIGADGANSRVRQLAWKKDGFHRGFAIEGTVPRAAFDHRPHAEFLLGYVESGYGWIFPKGDHVNVGIYSNRAHVHLSKARLREYIRERLGTGRLEHIMGYPLGFGGQTFWQARGRILLAGDAGGFAEPLLGEGLHNAIKSGQAAGNAICEIHLDNADTTLERTYKKFTHPIRRDIKRCADIAYRILYPHLEGLGGRGLMHPLSRYALLNGFAAGKTIRALTNGFLVTGFMKPHETVTLRDFHRTNGQLQTSL